MKKLALLFLVVLSLAGCGTSQPASEYPPTVAPATPDYTVIPDPPDLTTTETAIPTRVDIAKIGASSSLIQTGIKPDKTLETPDVKKPQQASWYNYSTKPGDIGPAVILGHIDGNKQKGIFYRLNDLVKNDKIVITSEDGTKRTFVVYKKVQANKNAFPTEVVYGNVDRPELRLITCGGPFVGGDQGYGDNIIVFAHLTP